MKNSVVLLPLLLFLSFFASAQSDSTLSHISYFFSVHSGGLIGDRGDGTFFSASSIQGVRYKRLALGIGIGYDAYTEWRALPFFASFGYDVFSGRNGAFFVQINSGYAHAWNPYANEESFILEEEGGYVLHPLAGYRISHGKVSLYFTAGYKIQDLSYTQVPRWSSWGPNKTTMLREVRRFSLQIGIGWQ